jgi:hypothetical protein
MEQASGVNAQQYFVCNLLGEKHMSRLPDVRPEQIVSARYLKRFLTGKLTSKVSTYPPFPWNEAVFLRAQIARISASTVLSPAGWYAQEEDENGNSAVAKAEEIEALSLPDGDPEEWLSNWVHRYAVLGFDLVICLLAILCGMPYRRVLCCPSHRSCSFPGCHSTRVTLCIIEFDIWICPQ